jgi:hypothetical protein
MGCKFRLTDRGARYSAEPRHRDFERLYSLFEPIPLILSFGTSQKVQIVMFVKRGDFLNLGQLSNTMMKISCHELFEMILQFGTFVRESNSM